MLACHFEDLEIFGQIMANLAIARAVEFTIEADSKQFQDNINPNC